MSDNVNRKWLSVAHMNKVTEIEIEHYIPEDGDNHALEAYDIKLKVPDEVWNYELDLPPHLAKKLYEKLGEIFGKK